MALEDAQRAARGGVPQAHRPIVVRRSHEGAICAECHRNDARSARLRDRVSVGRKGKRGPEVVHPLERPLVELRPHQRGDPQPRPLQHRPPQVRAQKPRERQVRAGEARARRAHPRQVRAHEPRPPQRRAREISPHEPRAAQIRAREIRPAQVPARQVLPPQIAPREAQPGPRLHAQPAQHAQRVVHGRLSCPPVVERPPRPFDRRLRTGERPEEVGHQVRHLPGRERRRRRAAPELVGRGARHQPLHHRLVQEREVALGVADQQRPRADLVRRRDLIELASAQVLNGLGHRVRQLRRVHPALGPRPQPQRERGHRAPAILEREAARRAPRVDPPLLARQPPVEQAAVEAGSGDRPPLVPRLQELGRAELGDEPEHPRVLRQAQQILHLVEQLHPRFGLVLAAEPVHQEAANLGVRERQELREAVARDGLRAVPERRPHLLIRLEVLRPAGQDDLRVPERGLGQRIEVLRGALVGHPQGELVEAVEQQRDAPLGEQVAERRQIDAIHAREREVLRDQGVQAPRLLERPHLDQDRRHRAAAGAHPPRQLVEQERLARAEVAQEHDEASVGRSEPLEHRRERVLARVLLQADRVDEPLRHEQARRVDRIGLEPRGLALDVGAEVDELLVVAEAHEMDAGGAGLAREVTRGRIAGEYERRDRRRIQAPVPRVDAIPEDVEQRAIDGPGGGREGMSARLAAGLDELDLGVVMQRRWRGVAGDPERAAAPLLPQLADLDHAVQEAIAGPRPLPEGLGLCPEPAVAAVQRRVARLRDAQQRARRQRVVAAGRRRVARLLSARQHVPRRRVLAGERCDLAEPLQRLRLHLAVPRGARAVERPRVGPPGAREVARVHEQAGHPELGPRGEGRGDRSAGEHGGERAGRGHGAAATALGLRPAEQQLGAERSSVARSGVSGVALDPGERRLDHRLGLLGRVALQQRVGEPDAEPRGVLDVALLPGRLEERPERVARRRGQRARRRRRADVLRGSLRREPREPSIDGPDRPEIGRALPRQVQELPRTAPEQRTAEVLHDRVAPLVEQPQARVDARRRGARADDDDDAAWRERRLQQRRGEPLPRRVVPRLEDGRRVALIAQPGAQRARELGPVDLDGDEDEAGGQGNELPEVPQRGEVRRERGGGQGRGGVVDHGAGGSSRRCFTTGARRTSGWRSYHSSPFR